MKSVHPAYLHKSFSSGRGGEGGGLDVGGQVASLDAVPTLATALVCVNSLPPAPRRNTCLLKEGTLKVTDLAGSQ